MLFQGKPDAQSAVQIAKMHLIANQHVAGPIAPGLGCQGLQAHLRPDPGDIAYGNADRLQFRNTG